jgi:hypothetical protein
MNRRCRTDGRNVLVEEFLAREPRDTATTELSRVTGDVRRVAR